MYATTGPMLSDHTAGGSAATERTLRLTFALLLMLLQVEGMLGLAWDIQWHISVGRDRFLTPPHILLYTSTALAGLLALAAVLVETIRYRRGRGVHDGNSVRLLWVFHAPVGLYLAGFGALITALAAPLDDYWHQLYGIDVTLWAPFHMMGLLGGFTRGLGSVYLWAALWAASSRARGRAVGSQGTWNLEAWGTAFALMLMAGQLITVIWPGQMEFPSFNLGAVAVMTYPVLLALALPWLLVGAATGLGLRGAASALIALLLARDLAVQLFVPWAVRTGAAAEGLGYRYSWLEPHFNWLPLLFDLGLLALAVTADVWTRRAQARAGQDGLGPRGAAQLGAVLGALAFTAGASVCWVIWNAMRHVRLPPELPIGHPPTTAAIWAALPVAVVAGALSALLGYGCGQVWKRSPR